MTFPRGPTTFVTCLKYLLFWFLSGKHYKLVQAYLKRDEANAVCNTIVAGASLAAVDSKELNDKLKDAVVAL